MKGLMPMLQNALVDLENQAVRSDDGLANTEVRRVRMLEGWRNGELVLRRIQRPLRIRIDPGPVGYLWLEWLGACAQWAGVVTPDTLTAR